MRLLHHLALGLLMMAAPAQQAPTTPMLAAETPLASGVHRFTVNGVELWYRVAGQLNGVPLVFLHGGPGEGSQVFQTIGGPVLETGQRLVYFDQRGSGRSDRPKDPAAYSLAILVDDIERLREHLGVPKIALLGHSFGTILGLEYAAKYPDRVAGLVIAAAVPDLPGLQRAMCDRLATEDPAASARAKAQNPPDSGLPCNPFAAYPAREAGAYFSRNMFPDPAVGKRVDELDNAEGVRNTGEMGGALTDQGLMRYRFVQPKRISAPVLIIAGGKDFQAAIGPQKTLAAELPNARLLEYADNGHFMFVEDPERFAKDVADFLRSSAR